MANYRRWLVAVCLVIGLGACGGTAAAPTRPPQLDTVPTASRAAQPATSPTAAASAPAVGLTGQFVYGTNDGKLWVVAADGSGRRQLTDPQDAIDFDPHWSPDGTQIVFRSTRLHPADPSHTGYDGIYVINADGSGLRLVSGPAGGLFPNWSADGSYIMFSGPDSAATDLALDERLLTVRPDGSRLVSTGVYGEGIEWSPDGATILLGRNGLYLDGPPDWDIWAMDADASHVRRLTSGLGNDYLGPWSPDGTQIAFQSERGGNADVYVMRADGSQPTLLVGGAGAQAPQAWLADGRILIADWGSGNALPQWYVVNADGSGRVSVPQLADATPPLDWRP
jgi:Tol biopolymer transport system component